LEKPAAKKSSRGLKIAVVTIIIVIIVVVGVFAVWTYPRTVLSFSVSFTAGIQTENKAFGAPMLDNWVQVQVVVNSGTALWRAAILNSSSNELWNHAAAQGGQTTYNSGWMQPASGNYNFTFATIGIGSLDADITVSCKGGFW